MEKPGSKVAKKRIAVLLAFLCLCLLIACKSTPAEDIVINKGDAETNPSIQDMLKSSPAPVIPYEAPEYVFKEAEEIKGCIFSLDAVVDVPPIERYPITLIEKWSLSDESILSWAQYFAGPATLIQEREKTKDDYAREIAAQYAKLSGLEEQYERLNQNADTMELIEDTKAYIADLQEKHDNAPETAPHVAFKVEDYPKGQWFQFAADEGNMRFQTMRGGQGFVYWRDPSEGAYAESLYPEDERYAEAVDRKWKQCLEEEYTFPKEAAIAIAEEALVDLGLTELAVSATEKCCFFRDEQLLSKAWIVTCTRDNHGLLSYRLLSAGTYNTAQPVIGAPWAVEHAVFMIDDTGIRIFYTDGLGKETRILLKNVALLSFDKVLERIETTLRQIWTILEGSYVANFIIEVQTIELRSALISIKDERELGMSIPVWRIAYLRTTVGENGDVSFGTMHLTLNARDGSYIEPLIPTSQLASYGDS